MDVDPPDDPVLPSSSSASSASCLKRSSSAPMIDQISDTAVCSPSFTVERIRNPRASMTSTASLSPLSNSWRPRRLSANHGSLSSPSSPHGLAPRVQQLKKEEGLDEVSQESDLHSTLRLSESWGDLSVGAETRHVRVSDPLTVNLEPWSSGPMSPGVHGSQQLGSLLTAPQPLSIFQHHSCPLPSPTRGTRLNTQLTMRSVSFSPSPSPSPTRKTFTTRRSQSPIAMRANQQLAGAVKRKCELLLAGSGDQDVQPLPKRLFGGLLMPQTTMMMTPSLPPSSTTTSGFDTPTSSSASSPEAQSPASKTTSLAKAMEQVTVTPGQ